MARRLVLGCGSIGHAVVVGLADRPGDLTVVDPDPDRVETLRNEGIAARRGDPTRADDVVTEGAVSVVFVAGDDPATNLATARAARERYPDAALIAYSGVDPSREQREALRSIADRTVDRGETVLEGVLETVEGVAGRRHRRLLSVLRDVPGRLGVFTHDNPDPDAIASAAALRALASAVGTEAEVCYFGDISHQENRALVNVLELELSNLGPGDFDPSAYDAYALVDHSRPGVNDQLPGDLSVDVVIDHHPPRGPIGGRFVDLREDAGSTSTLLAGYYRTLGVDIDPTIATALLYGIRVDTRDFGRDISPADFEAAAYLIEHADADVLARVESPSVTAETLSVLARSIDNREVRGSVLATSAGWTGDRDALAQAADTLLNMEDVTTVLVIGLLEETDTVVASARTRGRSVDIGEALRQAYDQIGSAGGHTDMAGAQIPLGILGSIEDDSGSLEEVIGDVLLRRFFEVVDGGVGSPPGGPTPQDVSTSWGAEGEDSHPPDPEVDPGRRRDPGHRRDPERRALRPRPAVDGPRRRGPRRRRRRGRAPIAGILGVHTAGTPASGRDRTAEPSTPAPGRLSAWTDRTRCEPVERRRPSPSDPS